MIKLPSDFELERYGIHVRLVREEDAEFIVKLRTDPQLARYLMHTDNDVSKQVNWIREYKKRETAGVEYYFIFFQNDKPIVLNRLHSIDWIHLTFTSASWIGVPGADYEAVMTCSVITEEIAYDILGLLVNYYDVRKGNKQVLNFHRNIMKVYQYGETESDYLFMSTPETRKKWRLKKLLGLE